MRKIFVLTALPLASATLSAMPRMKLAARYDYSPDGQLRSVTTPTSDTAAVKTTYKRSYVGCGKVRVSVYRETLENPSFAKFDYAESASSYEVASFGNVARGNNPGRLVSSYVARAGRRLNSVDALGNKTTYKYNRKGQLASTALISGNKESQLAAYKYDNKTGRLAATLDPLGRVTRRLYDRDGRLSTRVWPNGSTIKYRYDKKGLLSQKVEADRVTKYKYDDMNRLIEIKVGQAPAPQSSASGVGSSLSTTNLTYSKTGQLLTITNDNSTVEYKYDDFNRVTLEKSENGLVAYEYNPKGLLASKTVSVGKSAFTTTYAYDDLDRLTTVESPAGKYVYRYNKLGRVKSLTMGSAKVAFTYDKAGRLTAKTLIANGKKTTIAAYKYDKLNRRVSATVLDTAWKYKYDNKNQLIGAVADNSNGKQLFKYGFDSIGNRLSYSTALSKETFKYNDLNQLINEQYEYDKFGNLISTPNAQYRYNLNNRLVEVRKKDCILRYSYDPLGQRIKTETFSTAGELLKTTLFVMSGMVEQARVELDAKGAVADTRFHTLGLDVAGTLNRTGGVGAVLATTSAKSGRSLNYLYDGNGNVISLMDNHTNMRARFAYTPFGKSLAATGKDAGFANFTFSTKPVDESGLSYYGFRFYNAGLGRWLTRDPIEEEGGHNFYGFVGCNPIQNYDLFGTDYGMDKLMKLIKLPAVEQYAIAEVITWLIKTFVLQPIVTIGSEITATKSWWDVHASCDTANGYVEVMYKVLKHWNEQRTAVTVGYATIGLTLDASSVWTTTRIKYTRYYKCMCCSGAVLTYGIDRETKPYVNLADESVSDYTANGVFDVSVMYKKRERDEITTYNLGCSE